MLSHMTLGHLGPMAPWSLAAEAAAAAAEAAWACLGGTILPRSPFRKSTFLVDRG